MGDQIKISGNGKDLTIPQRLLTIKEVSGRILVAATPETKLKCPHVIEVLSSFKKTCKKDRFVEKEARDRIWKTVSSFLNAKGTFKASLGGWSRNPDLRGILIEDLPANFRDVIKENIPIKTSAAQPSFKIQGKEGKFAECFFEATSTPQPYYKFLA